MAMRWDDATRFILFFAVIFAAALGMYWDWIRTDKRESKQHREFIERIRNGRR